MIPTIADILTEVEGETLRARTKFGRQYGLEDVDWLAILSEEVGEAAMEVVKASVPPREPRDPAFLRAELVQAAAVAVRWVQAFDARDHDRRELAAHARLDALANGRSGS